MKPVFHTRRLVLCALFTAIGVLLSGPLSVPVFPLGIYSLKIGLGTLPVVLAGILFGPVYGGIVGAVAGREISKETGGSKGNKNVAAVAGAVGGALAGNAIQDRVTGDTYDVTVRMDDGRTIVINQRDLGGVTENTYVRVVNGRVVIR